MANWVTGYRAQGSSDIVESYIFFNGSVTIDSNFVATIHVSVGSQIRFWNYVNPASRGSHITEVDWSITGGNLISCDPSLTSYSLDMGKYQFVPANWADTAIISPGPSHTVFNDWSQILIINTDWTQFDVEKIAFYADKTVGLQVWTLLMKFANGTSSSISWNIDVQAPTPSFALTPPSGANVFQFGPYLDTVGGTHVDQLVPVPWTDPNYLNPPNGSIYLFGCISGGVNAWTFQGSVTNGTPSTGYAYCVQLVRVLSSSEAVYAKTNYDVHQYIPFSSNPVDMYITSAIKPKDGSGATQWGLDGIQISLTDFPWAYSTDAFTQLPANSGALAVPPANSIRDFNGTLQSFYADSPNRHIAFDPILSNILIEMNVNWQFVTHLVVQPDGGIPISLAQSKWYLDCNEYNATADKTPTLQNSVFTPTNWDLTKTFQTLGDNSFVPTYLQWFYNQWNYRGNVTPAKVVPRPKKAGGGGPNLAPMGNGPMGGAVTVPNFGNQALLPRGGAANFAGMNAM